MENKYLKALKRLDRKTKHKEEILILQELLDNCCFLKEETKEKYGISKTRFIETPALNIYRIKRDDYE